MVYQVPGEGFWTGGWRVGGIVNARSGVPINVTINRPDNITVAGATVTNIPGGNSRGTQRPDLVPGVDPYLKDGVRWLNPAAFATPQPGTFGNLPRNFLRGPNFWQADLMFSKDFRFLETQGVQVRVEVFNIANRLNYENPAASLPNGAPGAAVHRRAGRHVRLHAGTTEPHGRTGHRAADADLVAVYVLAGYGRLGPRASGLWHCGPTALQTGQALRPGPVCLKASLCALALAGCRR